MSRFVDLSHVVHDGMPGIRLKRRDGTVQEGTARIRTWLGREAMLDILEGQAAFEVTELSEGYRPPSAPISIRRLVASPKGATSAS